MDTDTLERLAVASDVYSGYGNSGKRVKSLTGGRKKSNKLEATGRPKKKSSSGGKRASSGGRRRKLSGWNKFVAKRAKNIPKGSFSKKIKELAKEWRSMNK